MKIHFKISYYTYWGQRLLVSGNIPELGNDDLSKATVMNYESPEDWICEVDVNRTEEFTLNCKYILYSEQTGQYETEWGDDRNLKIDPKKTEYFFCKDEWNSPSSIENVFLTIPFQNVLIRQEHAINSELDGDKRFTHIFKVKMPLLRSDEQLCVVGDCESLGNWSTNNPILLAKSKENQWIATVNIGKRRAEIHYKYGVCDAVTGKFKYFESGPDRIASVYNSPKTVVQLNDGFVRVSNTTWKGAGVGIPVFSLKTKKSFGVGDFGDLKLFVDWAQKVGLKLIQVLPLNDTTGTHTDADVLPYAAISAFALNPLFLNLNALGKLPNNHPLQQIYNEKQSQLNSLDLVAFLDVINYKFEYAKEIFLQEKDKFLDNKEFKQFFEKNEYWLVPYAAYCVLRDKYKTPDYRKWEDLSQFDSKKIANFSSAKQSHFNEIATCYFIQYQLHIQLLEATNYAHEHGIILKGDIPIGVNRNSVDTWAHPELFHMNMQAGAPPDMFAVKGQNWELPTYNWEMMERTGFDWWKKRFSQMSNYFDTFRIDHILGFFRIWQIPTNQIEGIMGHLNPTVSIHLNEFSEKGIWFDYNRFCKPYITDSILYDFFGEDTNWVKVNCLKIQDGWNYCLREDFGTQLAVENLFLEGSISERIKWGLFDLISNVLFFEVEGSNGKQFYPRFNMESLRSFRDLDNYTKDRLRELYIDYFFKRQDANWYQSGMEKLPALKRSTNMLICGEDLGMMTPCVTAVMKSLGILSLEVQRAPKSNKIEFFHPADAPYLSVVTPSTHDMSTIRGWWEEDRGVTQRFYNSQLGHWGEAPQFCDWWICRDILLQHLYSPAMWSIFQLQDLLGISEELRRQNPIEERINVPSNSMFSWRYRMHIYIEDLLEKKEFNSDLKNHILQSGG